jgi:hypothetical protein
MTMERDPLLQKLFDIANHDLPGEAFLAGIMAEIDALRRRAIIAWTAAGLVLAAAAWLLTPMMVAAVNLMSQALPQSLVEIDDPSAMINQVLSPLNSVAAVVTVTVLVMVLAYRKIF